MDTSPSSHLRPEDVLATEEMLARPRKARDHAAEVAAFRELSVLIATDPTRAVQRFLQLAMALCGAGSSGLSLLTEDERGEPIFGWDALAGAYASYVGGSTPRHFSPCGLCLDRDATVLVSRPARVFRYFEAAKPEIVEGLIVPVRDIGGASLGTLWVVHHDERRRFDSEDARVMEDLAVQLTLALRLLRDAAARDAARREVHHRVKNTLMATASILRLQSRVVSSAKARAALEEALGRLGVLAATHELLYRAATDAKTVDVTALLHSLADALRRSAYCADDRIRLRVAAEEGISLAPDAAVPLALVANEAVTNACKYAFPNGQAGEIEVRLERHPDGALALAVRDDGVGLPAQGREGGLGLKLMHAFARQVGASLTVSADHGTTIALALPAASCSRAEQPKKGAGVLRAAGAAEGRPRARGSDPGPSLMR